MLVLDYSSVYTVQFCWGGVSVCPGAALDYVPKGWVRVSHMVCDAYLFILQILASTTETGWWGEMDQQCREAFHRLGIWDVAEFNSD
jgi:hypothetical protein